MDVVPVVIGVAVSRIAIALVWLQSRSVFHTGAFPIQFDHILVRKAIRQFADESPRSWPDRREVALDNVSRTLLHSRGAQGMDRTIY